MIKPVSASKITLAQINSKKNTKTVKTFFNRELIRRYMDPKRTEIPWLRPLRYDIASFNLKDVSKLKMAKP